MDLIRFRGAVERQLGLQFDDGNDRKLESVLQRRMTATSQDCQTYLGQIESGLRTELLALGAELTVGETYFLRHLEQFRALTETVLPERLSGPRSTPELQLLSAGCATGEETYSLAIALREKPSTALIPVSILGIDVNPVSLAKARSGRYTSWSMRSVPPAISERWFRTEGQEVVLDSTLRDRVDFQQRNLALEDALFWQPKRFDVIFCRNVLMYFSPQVMMRVVGRMARSLMPGGYLFLGSAETLHGMSEDFLLRESHGSFYYQLKPKPALTHAVAPFSIPVPAHRPGSGGRSQPDRRPDVITLPGPAPETTLATAATAATAARQPTRDLGPAMALLRQERFGEALAAIEEFTPGTGHSITIEAETLLLRATLMVHSGDLIAAERTATHLLGSHQLAAEAHALLAICRESQAELPGAITHCRAAINIAPGFAMAHLHLGRLSQRIGDLGTARREYTESARLLPAESEARMLHFGGGFDREALISLCRTQSTRIGAKR